MNNAEQWISLDDRLPTEADLPVWYANIEKQRVWGAYYAFESKEDRRQGQYDATHWKHAKADIPAPPPRAKTLAELDAQAFVEWGNRTAFASEQTAFMAALAYERAEIARILGCLIPGDKYESRLYAIYKRVKGGAS